MGTIGYIVDERNILNNFILSFRGEFQPTKKKEGGQKTVSSKIRGSSMTKSIQP